MAEDFYYGPEYIEDSQGNVVYTEREKATEPDNSSLSSDFYYGEETYPSDSIANKIKSSPTARYFGETIEGLVSGLARGATLGATRAQTNILAAMAKNKTLNPTAEQLADADRAYQENINKAPVANFIGEVAGGFLPAAFESRYLPFANTRLGATVLGGAEGGIYDIFNQFGSGRSDFSDVGKAVAGNAALSGVASVAVPPVLRTVLGRKVSPLVEGKTVPKGGSLHEGLRRLKDIFGDKGALQETISSVPPGTKVGEIPEVVKSVNGTLSPKAVQSYRERILSPATKRIDETIKNTEINTERNIDAWTDIAAEQHRDVTKRIDLDNNTFYKKSGETAKKSGETAKKRDMPIPSEILDKHVKGRDRVSLKNNLNTLRRTDPTLNVYGWNEKLPSGATVRELKAVKDSTYNSVNTKEAKAEIAIKNKEIDNAIEEIYPGYKAKQNAFRFINEYKDGIEDASSLLSKSGSAALYDIDQVASVARRRGIIDSVVSQAQKKIQAKNFKGLDDTTEAILSVYQPELLNQARLKAAFNTVSRPTPRRAGSVVAETAEGVVTGGLYSPEAGASQGLRRIFNKFNRLSAQASDNNLVNFLDMEAGDAMSLLNSTKNYMFPYAVTPAVVGHESYKNIKQE